MKKIIAISILIVFSANAICQSADIEPGLSYYQDTFQKAKRQERTGTVLTIAGLTCSTLGYFMVSQFTYQNGDIAMNATSMLGGILFLSGGILANVGIPLWISGGIKARNNEKIIKVRYSLRANIDPKGFGVGLNFNF